MSSRRRRTRIRRAPQGLALLWAFVAIVVAILGLQSVELPHAGIPQDSPSIGWPEPGPIAGWPSPYPQPPATANHPPVATPSPSTQAFMARVVGVADGDTLTVLVQQQQFKVRLEGIDCPEKNQPFGQAAKQFTSDLCFGRDVVVHKSGIDRYGRILATVESQSRNLNEELLRAGLAWHYKQFSQDARLDAIEQEARWRRVGLWQDVAAVPPWEWRRR